MYSNPQNNTYISFVQLCPAVPSLIADKQKSFLTILYRFFIYLKFILLRKTNYDTFKNVIYLLRKNCVIEWQTC